MRRYSASVRAHVAICTDSDARPIRLRLGADIFGMTVAEATELANKLIDAVEKDAP